MSDYRAKYASKLTSAAELVGRFKGGDLVGCGVWYGEPYGVLSALGKLEPRPSGVTIFNNFSTVPLESFSREGFECISGFFSPYDRAVQGLRDNMHYVPGHFSTAGMMSQQSFKFDYFIYRVAPMDERGRFNFSLTGSFEYRLIPWLKEHSPETTIVFEVNSRMPTVFGREEFGNNELPIEYADVIVEDDSALLEFPTPPATDRELAIAKNVAPLIEDRSTLQLGFGTIPMAIGSLLSDRRDLGIHTEMFCEGHIDLIEAGAVTNAYKGLYDGVATATFATGMGRLHEWLRENPQVAMLPVEEVNRATVLARMNKVVSVNSILTIDMTGQACAHCIGGRTYSGLGGAFDFVYGSQLSPGGKSILCLPSTSELKDGTVVSNIVASHAAGARITFPEHIVEWVVTEFGAARLKFLTLEQRAAALLGIAHPDFREGLAREFRDAGMDVSRAGRIPDSLAVD